MRHSKHMKLSILRSSDYLSSNAILEHLPGVHSCEPLGMLGWAGQPWCLLSQSLQASWWHALDNSRSSEAMPIVMRAGEERKWAWGALKKEGTACLLCGNGNHKDFRIQSWGWCGRCIGGATRDVAQWVESLPSVQQALSSSLSTTELGLVSCTYNWAMVGRNGEIRSSRSSWAIEWV